MGYTISEVGDRFELALDNESGAVRVFQMRPSEPEPELQSGLWILLLVAVWSVPDTVALQMLMGASSNVPSSVHLGVRLYDDPREAEVWCRDIARTPDSPVWVALRDGKYLTHRVGLFLGVPEMLSWIQAVSFIQE